MAPTAQNFPQGEWPKLYLAALAETDETKFIEKLHEAEAAIFERLQQLCTTTAPEGERTALDNAIRALRVPERDTLRFPDWT